MMLVRDIVDRVLRDLEPPDEAWPRTALSADVDEAETALPIDVTLLTAEERRIAPGVIVEVDSEQMVVVSLTGSTLTVRRGERSTEAAPHATGSTVVLRPPFTRLATFEAVADEIESLSPPLYDRGHIEVTAGSTLVELPDDATSIVSIIDSMSGREVDFADLGIIGGTRKVRMGQQSNPLAVTYLAATCRPRSEDDSLWSLGVRPAWGRIVVAGALAQMMSARPLSVAQREFVAGQLRTDGYPVETPNRVRDALIRYREHLLVKAEQQVISEAPPVTHVVMP